MGPSRLSGVRAKAKSRSKAAGGGARSTRAVFCRPYETRFPFFSLTQDLRPELVSVAPPGLVPVFSAYPRLAPWAAFCRRFAAGVGWVLTRC
jgi:hypothetical protein